MKKLSVPILFILCVTIGGAYAAWSYTGSTVSSVDRTVSHGMTTATTDGDVGILRIVSNDVDVAIDRTAEGNYLAKLVITGSITVSFTPNPGAPDDVVNNAIAAVATLYTKNADANAYDGKEIYVAPVGSSVELTWGEKQPFSIGFQLFGNPPLRSTSITRGGTRRIWSRMPGIEPVTVPARNAERG